LLAAGKAAQAKLLLDLVLADDPHNVPALEGLIQLASASGDAAASRRLLERLVSAAPGHIDARLALGDMLLQTGEAVAARAQAEQVLAISPDHPPAYYMLGICCLQLGEIEAAYARFEDARLDLAPQLFGYIQYMAHLSLAEADWRGYDDQIAFFERRLAAGQASWQPTFSMLTSRSPADIGQAARSYAAMMHPAQTPLWQGERWKNDRIRLGFVTGEIADHPVAHLLVGVLENLDRSAFEVTGFDYGPVSDDPVRRRILAAFETFHEVAHLDDLAIARAVRRNDVDIAIWVGGYGHNSRPQILAHRPAPVQVNFLGYPGTMGAPWLDYLIADKTVLPESETPHYAEQIAWLPGAYQPTDNRAQIAPTPTRVQQGLPEGAFVFMAYNVAGKISPAIFDVWMRIMKRTPGSVLWLPAGEGAASANLQHEAQARGIDPARLVFAPRTPARAAHVARHRLADLFLDTLPFNAHSTASDALWAGLPVITCRGTTFPGRVCASLLTAAGLPELVTETLADYEDLAVALASDPMRLSALRRRVTDEVHVSPLFDTARYTRNLEAAFREMYAISQAGEPPRSFAVEGSP